MSKYIFLLILLVCSTFLSTSSYADSLELSTSGGWFLTVNEYDLTSGAGSNLKDTFLSPADATLIDVQASPKMSWTVYAKLNTSSVNTNLKVYVRRTSDGQGSGSIEGGEHFILLREGNNRFFSGIGQQKGITIQYMAKGIHLGISPGLLNYHIIYFIENP